MKLRTDGFSHYRAVEIGGDCQDAGNGIQLNPAAASADPTVEAVGDDTTVSLRLRAKVAGTATTRIILNGAPKTISDSATDLFTVACASGAMSGGFIDFLVRASNGTDHQALAGRAAYSCVNKAGTHTGTITYTTAPEAKAVSSGTLTLAFAITTGTNLMTVSITGTGSLTETTYTIEYNVQPIRGSVTIL